MKSMRISCQLFLYHITYTFGTAGSVFAASYTLDDYASALTSEKAAQLTYLEKTKNQVVGAYTFDSDGFSTAGYMKAAYEAVADEVIADATTKMDAAINGVLNTTDWPKSTAPDKTVVSNVTTNYSGKDLTTAAGMKAVIEAKTDALDKAQAPLSKAFVESKLNVDLSKYNSTDKKYTIAGEPNGSELTAVQAVERAISVAKDAIAAADKQTTDKAKIDAYKDAYTNFKTALGKIKTLADEEFEGGITAGTVEAAVEQLATILLKSISEDLDINPNMAADATVDWSTKVAGSNPWVIKAFWEADKTVNTKGTFFGVAIADITKVTRSEVAAVNSAYKAAVASAKAPLKAYANGDVSKITALSSKAQQYTALANATSAVSKYADVVAAGEKMKAEYNYGIKKYDDAKVAQAVKAAEQLVYNDLMNGYANKTAESYIIAAAASEGISLEQVNYELQRFNKAVADAAKKMYSDGLTAKTPAVKVSYGDNKTPEADLVYLRGTYDSTEYTAWAKIAQKAIEDLKAAQSYDEITSIMNKAAEDFNKLLHADVAADVKTARTSYKTALTNYGTLKKGLLDKTAYPAANINAAVEQGKKLIDKATTVDAVKAAYEQGKAIVDGLKTADELKTAKEAVEKQIAALPYTAKLTVADKATVKAAYAAYDAYMNLPGAADIAEASKTLLKEKYNKVNTLEAEAIDAKAKAINEQLSKIATNSGARIQIVQVKMRKFQIDNT